MTAPKSPRPVTEPCSQPGEATTPAPGEGVHAVASTPVRDAQAAGSPPPPGPQRCNACGHVAIPAAVCTCKHLAVFHDLKRDHVTRTACSVSDGRKATPCGCRTFQLPEENSHV